MAYTIQEAVLKQVQFLRYCMEERKKAAIRSADALNNYEKREAIANQELIDGMTSDSHGEAITLTNDTTRKGYLKVRGQELKALLNTASADEKSWGDKVEVERSVLSAIKELRGDDLTITAADLDQTVVVKIPVQGGGEAVETLIDGKRAAGIIGLLNDESLDLTVSPGKLQVKRAGGVFTLTTATSPEKFPLPPDMSEVENWTIFDAPVLNKAFRGCLMGTVDGEGLIRGSGNRVVEFHIEKTGFTCYATDGHRIAAISGKCERDEPAKLQFPVYAIRSLLPALESDALIFVGEDSRHIYVKLSETLMYAFRKLTVSFPDVKTPLGQLNYDRVVTANTETVAHAIEIVKQLADEQFKRINWQFENGGLTFSTAAAAGEISETIALENTFQDYKTAFNFSYILPVLKQIDGDAELAFSDNPLRSIKISSNNGVQSSVVIFGVRME